MWIKVETQIEAQKLAFEIESSGLYQLYGLQHIIELQDKICNIYILKDMIIIRAEDRDFRYGAKTAPFYKDNRRINNIDAYDWQGNHLWNIGDIVYPTGSGYDMAEAFPRDFAIQFSVDGETWVDILTKTDYKDVANAVPSFQFEAVTARYVRVYVTRGTGSGFALAEIEVFHDDGSLPPADSSHYKTAGGEDGGTNVALNRPVTASSNLAGWDPSRLTDGNHGTLWSSALNRHATADEEEYFTVDLMDAYTLDRIVLIPRVNDEYFPQIFEVQVSDDGETFTTVKTVEYPTQNKGTVPITVKLEDTVQARYVRIRATKLRDLAGFGDGFLFQLSEIEIYNK